MKQITNQPKKGRINIWTETGIFSVLSILFLSSAQSCTVTNVSLYVGYGPAAEEINKTTIYVSYLSQPFYVKVTWDSTPGDFEIAVKNTATNETIAYADNVNKTGESPYQWTNPAINNMATGTYTIKAYVKRKDNAAEGQSNTCSVVIFKIDVELNTMDELMEENPGLYLPLNNDDDDADTIIDRQDSFVSGTDGDLRPLIITCQPLTLTGNLTLSWGSNVKLWETTNKETEITKTTYTATELPKTYYVEGYNVSSSLKDTEIALSHTFSDGTTGEDKAKGTVYTTTVQ